jgi:hypothetical protein
MRPSDLRVAMEDEARRLRAELAARGEVPEPSTVAALVLETVQSLPHVQGRLDMLWRYVEDYVRGLDLAPEAP